MKWWRRRRARRAVDEAKVAYAEGSRAAAAGRFDLAAPAFARAVERIPSWPEARVNLGSACYQLASVQPPEAAKACLEQAVEQFEWVVAQPQATVPASVSVPAALNLAAALHALGRRDDAIDQLEALARSHPDHRDVHFNLALAYAQAGRVEEAKAAVAAELALDGGHVAALELRGRLEGGASEAQEGPAA
jgi:tetratricopeptide (TPR) repeat protein